MVHVLYNSTASMYCEIDGLHVIAADLASNVLTISKTCSRRYVMVVELSIKKDSANGRKGYDVTIMVMDTIPAVPHDLPDIPTNDILVYIIGLSEFCLTVNCV